MLSELESAFDQICRRNLARELSRCDLAMRPAAKVIDALILAIDELGPTEYPVAPYEGPALDIVARLAIKSMCAMEAPHILRVIDAHGRNAVRSTARMVLFSVRFLAMSGQGFGPLPAGLEGRSLGFAALACGALDPSFHGRRLN